LIHHLTIIPFAENETKATSPTIALGVQASIMEHQQNQPPQGGVPGPTGRRLHIAHRRSPSELTPLMSMFSSPGSKLSSYSSPPSLLVVIGSPTPTINHVADHISSQLVEQLAIQQQIELLQQQQQQIQATHQQYVNMGMIPPTQHLAPPNGGYNPLQPMQNLSPQNAFQFPNQMQQQQQMNAPMGAPTQPLSHRRNQSALPNMGMGPPPAPSSGAAGSAFGDFGGHNRGENIPSRGGRGGGPPGGGHQRRHSLALPEAKKAAEIAQQKRTTSGFQFPIPGAAGASTSAPEGADSPGEDKNAQGQSTGNHVTSGSSLRARGSGHGRSQSMAVGVNGRGGSSMRGGGSFSFPAQPSADAGAGQNDFQRRGSATGHARNSSRNFESNWRNQPPQGQIPPQDQQGQMGSFGQGQQQHGGFQPGHRNRGSMNQSVSSIGNFQYGGQPQLVQLPQGQMALVQPQMYPGQQLNPLQINQLQALQAAQMNGQIGLQGSQHAPQLSAQQQQQQRKTLFTPYLPQATLPALLGDGQLVSGILRVNKKNRSDAYVSTQDGLLDADIFICGSKDRNRALEGDLVAVELLDVDEVWGQKREKEEKKKRKDITDTRTGGSTNGTNDRSHRDNSTNGDDPSSTAEGGIRRRGSLRQRPTQKKNDDVEVEGQSLLLVEEEEVNDDQKPLCKTCLMITFSSNVLNEAITDSSVTLDAGHIVAVIERVAGQMFSGTLGLLRPSSQATKEKQEAERQARDGNNGRHQEQRQQDKPKIVWFKPTE
jgi:protein SSD1